MPGVGCASPHWNPPAAKRTRAVHDLGMDSLKLRVVHQAPEPVDFEVPTGLVWIERGPQRAALFTPDEIEPGRQYPLVTVLHGAGRQDEALMRSAWENQARRAGLEEAAIAHLRNQLGIDPRLRSEEVIVGFLRGAGFVDVHKLFSATLYGSWAARRS